MSTRRWDNTILMVSGVLAEAFYRGLGAGTAAVTPPLRKRHLAIARDLVDVGATPLVGKFVWRNCDSAVSVLSIVPVPPLGTPSMSASCPAAT